MLDSLKKEAPTLVKDIEENVKLGKVQKVLGHCSKRRCRSPTSKRSSRPSPTSRRAIRSNRRGRPRPTGPRRGRAIPRPRGPDPRRHPAPGDRAAFGQSILGAQQGGGLASPRPRPPPSWIARHRPCKRPTAPAHEPVLLTTGQLRRHLRQIAAVSIPICRSSAMANSADIQVEVVGTIGRRSQPAPPKPEPPTPEAGAPHDCSQLHRHHRRRRPGKGPR